MKAWQLIDTEQKLSRLHYLQYADGKEKRCIIKAVHDVYKFSPESEVLFRRLYAAIEVLGYHALSEFAKSAPHKQIIEVMKECEG